MIAPLATDRADNETQFFRANLQIHPDRMHERRALSCSAPTGEAHRRPVRIGGMRSNGTAIDRRRGAMGCSAMNTAGSE
jgi:hypothetical protein